MLQLFIPNLHLYETYLILFISLIQLSLIIILKIIYLIHFMDKVQLLYFHLYQMFKIKLQNSNLIYLNDQILHNKKKKVLYLQMNILNY